MDQLHKLEWVKIGNCWTCPECFGKKPRQPNIMDFERVNQVVGHRSGCSLADLIDGLERLIGVKDDSQ